MRVLVIGGTVFVGRHIVDAALAAGHEVTRFHRGKTDATPSSPVETIHGDRDGGLHALSGRTWDIVIDTCGYVPRLVRASAEFLKDSVSRYVFVSTVSVYAGFETIGLQEYAPLGEIEGPSTEVVDAKTYGPLKAHCERAVGDVFGDRCLIVRPGIIVGPHDPTDRFTYWIVRIAEGGHMLGPGKPEAPIQFIDARDLAAWTISMIERDAHGVYHTVGPNEPTTWGSLLFTCCEVAQKRLSVHWLPDGFLLEQGVSGWKDLPLWLPPAEGKQGLFQIDGSRAREAGLITRSTADVVRDTLRWWRERAGTRLAVGIGRERIAEILRAWNDETK